MIKQLLLGFMLFFLSYSTKAAVILQYHHVSAETPTSTSVSPELFEQHLRFLKENNYRVVSVSDLLTKISTPDTANDKLVAITFDDGYKNIFENARPILQKYAYPYAVFVNPKAIDVKSPIVMTWEQLSILRDEGVEIGNHTMSHHYLVRKYRHLPKSVRLSNIQQEIEAAQTRLANELGVVTKWIAYPYGEFSLELQQLIIAMGYTAFGQHSGPVGKTSNKSRLPRFPASGAYADLKQLASKLKTKPFSIKSLISAEPLTASAQPTLAMRIEVTDFKAEQLVCYVSGQGAITPIWTDEDTFEVTANAPLSLGRSRYNCTAQSLSQPDRFYWFSQPWIRLQPLEDKQPNKQEN